MFGIKNYYNYEFFFITFRADFNNKYIGGMTMVKTSVFIMSLLLTFCVGESAWAKSEIIHDAEYYILEAQHAKKWTAQDKKLDQLLEKLKKKHGTPPNIIHIMWDDTAFGDVGIPAIQQVRGLSLIHISEPTRPVGISRMPSSA